MEKKYVVRLTDAERETLWSIVRKLSGSSQKVQRAQVLLKADADGPNWTDKKIAEAFSCRTKTVENFKQLPAKLFALLLRLRVQNTKGPSLGLPGVVDEPVPLPERGD